MDKGLVLPDLRALPREDLADMVLQAQDHADLAEQEKELHVAVGAPVAMATAYATSFADAAREGAPDASDAKWAAAAGAGVATLAAHLTGHTEAKKLAKATMIGALCAVAADQGRRDGLKTAAARRLQSEAARVSSPPGASAAA